MNRPPRFPMWLLRLIANRNIVDEIEGDLHEDFLDNLESKGLSKARRIYLWTAFRSVRPYLLAHKQAYRKPKYIDMVIYHLKMATRHMSKSRVFTAINIFGLTIGLASSLAILLFVLDQRQTDDFQSRQDRIYRLESALEREGVITRNTYIHSNAMPTIAKNIPGIETYVRMSKSPRTLLSETEGKQSLIEEDFLFVDPDFFKVFDFEILSGNPDKLIDEPSSVVITESAALRHFGHTDVVGKTISSNSEDAEPRIISALMADPPGNSSLQFDFVSGNAELFPPSGHYSFKTRFSLSLPTYLLLSPGTSPDEVADKIVPELSKHTDKKNLVESVYSLNSFEDLKYDIAVSDRLIAPVDKRVIGMFSIIAVFIISLALINYINLTSARSIQRAHEVGVRKVVGAGRKTLVNQLLTESLVICLIALPLAILALELIIPSFETILERKLFFEYRTNPAFLAALLGFTLLLSGIAGLYPALLLSRFKFSHMMKGRPEHGQKGSLLRKALVIFQFTFSIALIICVFLVQNQLDFVRNKTLSYSPEHIIVLKGQFGMLSKNYKTVKAELGQLPGVDMVSMANSSPGDDRFMTSTHPKVSARMSRYVVDEDYLKLFNLNMVEGSYFNPLADSATTHVIINQALADVLELEDPLYSTAFKFHGRHNNKIIGIVENFHFESLRDEIKPVIIAPAASLAPALTQVIVKVENTEFDQTIKNIEAVWNKFFPDVIFDYQFLDDKLDRLYTAEYRLSKIFGLFTVLAILITCLGLFGLSMHISEVKLKEVSIRKVLGASITQIMRLLSGQVYWLVGIAALIASPLAWYFMNQWLQDFAYKTVISADTFVITLIACLILATLTISWHALKTARTNPAETLRNE
ncbi:MAG: FtsX-like permease family protein [Roseivirga sp.]|nr:FtsX-like permease family protein [Roseivirga sp.]